MSQHILCIQIYRLLYQLGIGNGSYQEHYTMMSKFENIKQYEKS